MKIVRIVVGLFCVYHLAVANLYAQPNLADNSIRFSHLSVEDGLPNVTVSSIVQDHMGFMWFGTLDGLCKYDGYKYTIYQNDPEDSTSLGNNEIWSVFEDSMHNLWVATRGGGLCRYIRETDSFVTFTYAKADTTSISSNIVMAIYEDRDKRLWIGTREGLNLFDRETNKFTRFLHEENNPNSLSHGYVRRMYEDKTGNFWIATVGGGLNLLNRETKKFTCFKHDPHNLNSLSNNILHSISGDNDGNLWVGTDSGLDRIDLSKKQVVFNHYKHNNLISGNLGKGRVHVTYTDLQSRVWVGTEFGIYLFNKENNSFIPFQQAEFNTQSLSQNQIFSIYQDKSGLLWFGTHWDGIYIYNPTQNVFKHFKYENDNPKGLSNKSILAFHEDKNGEIWIGVDHGGLNLFNKEKKNFKDYVHHPDDPNSLSANAVLTIGEDSYGELWIGTWGGGVNRFNKKDQKFIRYKFDPNDPGALCDPNVYAILEDSRKNIWLGTFDCGLHLFNRDDDNFTHFYPDINDSTAISEGGIWAIFEDSKENIWIGTNGGLNLFDSERKRFKVFKNNKNNSNSLPNNEIATIFEDSKGRLWFGTRGGLCLYDYSTQSFKTYTTKNGLPNNMVGNIQEDNQGNLWLGTFKGLSRFDPDAETFQNYVKKDGLLSDQINVRSSLKSSTGELYFGSPNGFILFRPEDLKSKKNVPPVVVTNIQIFTRPVKIGSNSPLKKHISVTDEITLTHRDYVFSFEFAALDYAVPEKNKYKYILENFEDEWNYKSAEDRTATYTNLSAGEYIFKVQGSNNDGLWNQESTTIKIIVLPPWWLTWWAYMFYFIIFISGIWLYIYFRLRKSKQQKQILEGQLIHSEKMASIGVLTAGITHEINNPINFISSGTICLNKDFEDLLHILNNLKELPKDENALKERVRLVGKLVEEYDLQEILQSIPQTIEDIQEGVNRTSVIIKGLSLYSRADKTKLQKADIHEGIDSCLVLLKDKYMDTIEIIKDYDLSIGRINCFPGQLNQVFMNLISNAIDAIVDKGTVTVSTQLKNKKAVISIRDTGIGMPDEIIKKIFDPFYTTKEVGKGTGLGLSICQGIIDNHKGSIEVKSEAGKGSEFILTLSIL